MGSEDAAKTEAALFLATGEVEPSQALASAPVRRELIDDLWLTPAPTVGGTPLEPTSFRGALLEERTESYAAASIREALDEGLPFRDEDPTEVDDQNPFHNRGLVQRSRATVDTREERPAANPSSSSDEGEVVVTGLGAYAPRPASGRRERSEASVLHRLRRRPVKEVDHLDNHRRISTGEQLKARHPEDPSTTGSAEAKRSR